MAAPMKSNAIRDTRITLSVPKNIYDGVRSLAQIQDKSVNDFVCRMLEIEVSKNAELLQQYHAAKNKLLESLNSADT